MTGNWTVSSYSRIPGLRSPVYSFNTQGESSVINLIQSHPENTSYKTPLDYSFLSSVMFRGSVKICLQFFTSAFISARFLVQFINAGEYPGSYAGDYTNGISKIINVKGDTIDTITLPYMSRYWWTGNGVYAPQIQVTCDSSIANTDTTVDPTIYMLLWVSGGDDIQFAMPTTVLNNWGATYVPPPTITMQTSVGKLFQSVFAPICENNAYDIDTALCTTEQLGDILSITKRYSPYQVVASTSVFPAYVLDYLPAAYSGPTYLSYYAFRSTYFGSWRSCFMFRSGGYRLRSFYLNKGYVLNSTSTLVNNLSALETIEPFDGCAKFSVPPLMVGPFCPLRLATDSEPVQEISIDAITPVTSDQEHPVFLASRDDVQFGYPILPRPFGQPV